MNLEIVLVQGLLWSCLWIMAVAISVRVFPFTIEHDYPEDVRELANIAKPSPEHKRKGIVFAIISFSILFGLLVWFVVSHYKGQEPSFIRIFSHTWLVCMIWNMVDLVVVDWLFICLMSVKYFVLPGTEHYEGNRNFLFHFKGFVKGAVTMSVVAFIFTIISYYILLWLK